MKALKYHALKKTCKGKERRGEGEERSSVGMPRYLPWWRAFSPLGKGLRNESEGTLGIFDGF